MWWNGPHWLASDPIQMPDQPAVSDLASLITLELKTVVCNAVTPVPPEWIEERYSSYHKSQHGSSVPLTTSLQNCSTIPNESTSISTHPRLPKPSIFCFIELLRSYPHELAQLTTNQPIRSTSNLLSLSPIMGEDGLIRVGGRLSNSHLSMSQIHPPILPSRDHVTELMFKYNIVVLGHCGPTLLLSTIGACVHVDT